MSEERKPSTPGNDNPARIPAFAWLILAFVPSLVALLGMKNINSSGGFVIFILILTVVCCVSSGIGILSKTKELLARFALGLLLGGVFFVFNAIVVLFIGCSQMHF